jgi:hypothetical protein
VKKSKNSKRKTKITIHQSIFTKKGQRKKFYSVLNFKGLWEKGSSQSLKTLSKNVIWEMRATEERNWAKKWVGHNKFQKRRDVRR